MNQRTKTRYKNQLAKIAPDLQEKIQTYNANERMRCITMNHRLGKHDVKVVYNLFKKQFTQLTILENTINI